LGLGAGPVSGAAGLEWRRELGNNIDNPGVAANVASDYLIQYGSSFAGRVTVQEAYLEGNVPVLKDMPFAKRLDFDVAIRESHYDNQGLAGTDGTEATNNLFTWKASANYEVVDWLRFRGSQSHDARAANFRELYYQQLVGAGGLYGYCGPANTQTQPCTWTLTGNAHLRPEQSDTTTIGVVLTPKDWVRNFQFAADYFRINIKDAIQQASVQSVLNGCQQQGIAADCALLTPATPGNYTDITAVKALATNGSGYLYKGVDLTGSYSIDLGAARALDFRLLATRMIDQMYQPLVNGPFVNVVGQTGQGNSFLADFQPTAKWTSNLTGTYSQGPMSFTGQMRWVSSGTMNYNGVETGQVAPANGYVLSSNHIPSYEVFNLNASYKLPELVGVNMTVFGSVNNLLDKTPPVAVGVGAFGASNGYGGTNPVFYDTFGRTFKLGVRATF
jgi:iron complex outermembrane receptor protein